MPRRFRHCCKSTIYHNGFEISVDSLRNGRIALEPKHKQEYRADTALPLFGVAMIYEDISDSHAHLHSLPPRLQPLQNFASILIRRKDRVPHLDDPAILHSHRQPLRQSAPLPFNGRQFRRRHKPQPLITQQLIRQVHSLLELPLIRRALRAQPEDSRHAVGGESVRSVAERARLRGAAAGTGDLVPFLGDALAWGGAAGVAEDDAQSGEC
jgi:hypothetical protein